MGEPNYSRDVLLDLVDVVDQDRSGQLRTNQRPADLHQEVSRINISVRRLIEAHGLYDKNNSKQASLIVLRFKITSKDADQTRRVKALLIEFRLEKVPKKDNWHDPFLVSFAPGLRGDIYINPLKEKRVEGTEAGIEVAADAPAPFPGHLGAHKNWTTSTEREKDSISKISADSKKTVPSKGERQGDDVVWWNITENASKEDGIADTIAVAVLVKREASDKFQIHLNMEVTVDVKYQLANLWRKITSKRHEPLGFDPMSPVDEEDGFPNNKFDRNNLREFADNDWLDKLAFVHLPEQLKTAKFLEDNN
ncbi:hypothetical protein MMC18_007207 [Xylographa bjoerkii]|nr:hypothetical protein [Xylographa bjoerkii]